MVLVVDVVGQVYMYQGQCFVIGGIGQLCYLVELYVVVLMVGEVVEDEFIDEIGYVLLQVCQCGV